MTELGRPVAEAFPLKRSFHGFTLDSWSVIRLVIMLVGGLVFMEKSGASPGSIALLVLGELAAFLVLFPGVTAYLWRLRSTTVVEVFEHGFRARFAGGRAAEVAFEDVASVAADFRTLAPNGVHWGESGGVTVSADGPGGDRTVALYGDFKGSLPDEHPFLALYAGCREAAKRRVLAALSGGRSVVGKDWLLTARGVSSGKTIIYFEELTAAEMEEGEIRVWSRGSDEPAMRLSSTGPNAFVLLAILREKLAAAGAPAQAHSSLGRVIFKRWWFGMDGAIITLVGGFVMLLGALSASGGGLFSRVFWGLAGVAWLYFLYRLFTRRFFVHERGARATGLLGETALRDEEVDALTFAATRYYVNGAYQGTIYDVRLGGGAPARRELRFKATLSAYEKELTDFRHRLAVRLAERLLAEVRSGAERPWCGHEVLTPGGLRVRPKRLIGHGAELSVPYSDIGELQFAEGSCNLYRRSKPDECVTSVEQNDPNFWPGFYAVRVLSGQ